MADGIRLSLIDDSNRHTHSHLRADDVCYYLFEYTSHRDFSFSATNRLIINLKKKPSRSNQNEMWYKRKAIEQCAQTLRTTLNPRWLKAATLVPIPGSKTAGDPDFDDRMTQVCRGIANPAPDVREIVTQRASTRSSHEAGDDARITVPALLNLYDVNEALCAPTPEAIAIVDDVLTAGTHFRAMHTKLAARFPNVPILGLFIARRVFAPGDELPEFDDLPPL